MAKLAEVPDTTKVETNHATRAAGVDMKFEIVVIPVSDVDRAKAFYEGLGWRLDADFSSGDEFRVIQFTPPGSACSVIFGRNVTPAAPGSAQGLYLIVSNIEAARDALLRRGVEVSEIFHGSYRSFASFRDPDGNGWLFQEVTTRLPGRIDSAATTFASATDLASALRRAAAAHGQHEARTGQADANWPDWYAEYMAREQAGEGLPQ